MAGARDFQSGTAGRPRLFRRLPIAAALAAVLSLTALPSPASADTLMSALAAAYWGNPEINAARAGLRATDESLPQAKSFLRPSLSAESTLTGRVVNSGIGGMTQTDRSLTGTAGLAADQFLFRGFRTRNGIRQAEADIRAGRESLRNTIQNVLFDAAQAYFDVILNRQIVAIRRTNIFFLEEQVRNTQAQFELGESTITDVAQTRAELGLGQSDLALARSNLSEAEARYTQLIGRSPTALRADFPFERLAPNTLAGALSTAQGEHPAILSAIFQADAAAFETKQVEGELLPTVSLGGSLDRTVGFDDDSFSNSATVQLRVSVPLYQGGALASRVRQAKETLGQRRIEVHLFRDQVRAAVATAWAQIDAYRAAIAAAQSQIEAAGSALRGAQEEQAVGQRTRLDVLNAQRELRRAEESLMLARRNLALAYFSLGSATGRLSPEQLGLPTPIYRPEEHYVAVKDKWYGVRTPDGR